MQNVVRREADDATLSAAVRAARFDELRAQESKDGFRERRGPDRGFFRAGVRSRAHRMYRSGVETMTSPVARRPVAARVLICLEAGALLTISSVAVRVFGSARVTRLLGAPSLPDPPPTARAPVEAQRVGRVVGRVAGVLPWRPTCLRQALAVRWMLRRRGIASQCHLGVFTVAPFAAHAWVTVDGAVVVGGPVTRATRVSTFA